MPEEDDDNNRGTTVPLSSQFMLKFTSNLETLIKNDLKDENSRTDAVLRSISMAASPSMIGNSPANSHNNSGQRVQEPTFVSVI